MPETMSPEQIAIIKELSGRTDLNPNQQAIVNELMSRMQSTEAPPLAGEPAPTATEQPPPTEQRTLPQEIGKQAALTGRYLLEGTAGTLGMIVDPIAYGLDKIPGYSKVFGKYMPLKEIVSHNLSSLGVPEPETEAEKIIGEISTAIAGAGTGAGIAGSVAPIATGTTQGAAQAMAAQPGAQLAGAASGAAAQQAAQKAGFGPKTQFAASLLGSVAGAGATQLAGTRLQPSSAVIPEGLKEAEKRGIDVLTEDVFQPQTGGGKTAQSALGRIAGGTGPQRAAQQIQRTKAAEDFIRQYGGDAPTEMLNDVFSELQKKRQFKFTKYNKLKTDVIEKLDKKGNVPVTNTIDKIDKRIAEIRKFDETNPIIAFYEEFKNKIQNKSLKSLEELRKDLGDNISAASKDPTKAINKRRADEIAKDVYASLKEDMGNFIQQNGQSKDYNKWMAGNKKLSDMMKELEVGALKNTLNNGEATPETVKNMLFTNKPSVNQLLYKNLTPQGKKNAQAALVQKALWDTSKGRIEELSPDIFKNKLRDMQKQTGIFFTGDDLKAIEGLYKALKITEAAGKQVASPSTGQQNLPGLILSLMGGAGAGGGAMIGGATGAIAGAIGVPLTVGTLAKSYNSKPVRDALIQLSRLKIGDPEAARAAKRLLTALQLEKNRQDEENRTTYYEGLGTITQPQQEQQP